MVLKAVFVEFSGVIIKDADLKKSLINEILIAENLRPNDAEYDQICKGSSDRACLEQLLNRRGRVTNQDFLDKLLVQKSQAYIQQLADVPKLPIYPGLEDLLYKIKAQSLALGLLTSTAKPEVDWVLERANLTDAFSVVVTAQDLAAEAEKPSPQAYQVAIARLNEQLPRLSATPEECLAVEAFYSGIAAAKSANVPVVGVAHCYPYRMIQRRANWVVDYLNEIDFDWIGRGYEPAKPVAAE